MGKISFPRMMRFMKVIMLWDCKGIFFGGDICAYELAQKIDKDMRALGDYLGVKVHACVGGTSVHEDQRTYGFSPVGFMWFLVHQTVCLTCCGDDLFVLIT
ncbi:hypothetical protein DITRI_Ditri03aG0037000 [Diplodiscus trichospermus]